MSQIENLVAQRTKTHAKNQEGRYPQLLLVRTVPQPLSSKRGSREQERSAFSHTTARCDPVSKNKLTLMQSSPREKEKVAGAETVMLDLLY